VVEIMNDANEEVKEEALKISKNKKERRKKISFFGTGQMMCLK
jgi:hypothetical protein